MSSPLRAEQQTHERVPRWRCPVGEGIAPARCEHAEGFGDGPIWIGEMREAQVTDDSAELARLKRKIFGVPLMKCSLRTSRTGDGQHIRRKVQARNCSPPLRRGCTEPPGAAGDIEHGVPVNPKMGRITFEDASKDLLNDYKVNKKKSHDHVKRRIDLALEPAFRGKRLLAITTDADDAGCTGTTYPAGKVFVDSGYGHAHFGRNEGTGNTELWVTYLDVPVGASPRIDVASAPGNCAF